jgi:hypothetical protein
MTEQQIDLLRTLIQAEIEYAIQNENDYRFAFEQDKANEQAWETFKRTFRGGNLEDYVGEC